MNVKMLRLTFLIFGTLGMVSLANSEELLDPISWKWENNYPKFQQGTSFDKVVANGFLYIPVPSARVADDLEDPKNAKLVIKQYDIDLGGWQSRRFDGKIGTKVWEEEKSRWKYPVTGESDEGYAATVKEVKVLYEIEVKPFAKPSYQKVEYGEFLLKRK